MSLSKAQIKYYKSLKLKKFREKHGVFSIEGAKICKEILNSSAIQVKSILVIDKWLEENVLSAKKHASKIIEITEKDLKQISNFSTPNQIYILCEKPNFQIDHNYLAQESSIYLDNIQDPGNLGTIFRTADWFGIQYIFCSKGCVEWTNPKVIQSTMGAFLRVNIIDMEFDEFQKRFPKVESYAAVLGGENLFEMKNLKKGLIIIGNESKGVSNDIIEKATYKISIPKGKNGGAESLNAGIAAGIICSRFL